jgi:hypothetical protein
VQAGTARITLKAHGGTNVFTSMTVTVKGKTGYGFSEDEGYAVYKEDEKEDKDAVRSLDDDLEAAAPPEPYSLSESRGDGEKDGGCDVGLGLLALIPAAVLAARKRTSV